jgi:hypothetical protein
MLVDAKDVTSGTTLSADVCVIGAGAAEITMARTLEAAHHTLQRPGEQRPGVRTA